VPKVRGRERSVAPDEIVAEINQHAALGYREVVLTGTQLGSYGFDIPGMSLTRLLERVLSATDVPRLRVSSLQPQDLSPGLLALWSDHRLCPHFHMPLQSGSDPVLARMRRRYTAGQYADAVERVRGSVGDVSITADVLVGFPGETESDFQATFALCERVEFAGMHVFPYSVRPGTSAAHFDGQVPSEAKARRVRALMELGDVHSARFRARSIGEVRPVLWEEARESDGQTAWSGLTDNYIRVVAESHERLANTIRPARLVSAGNGAVTAEVL
jgi:threonylcarbamoyladenosine tRNA methylthiotransferase MtaB